MHRLIRLSGLALLTALLAPAVAHAQASTWVFIGGGGTVPVGDYGDFAKTGYLIDGGVGRTFGTGRVFAFVDGFYGRNKDDVGDDATILAGGGANIGISSTGPNARAYVYAGLGLQNAKLDPAGGGSGTSETNAYGRGAVGASFGSGKVTYWIEAGIIQGFGADNGNVAHLPLLAGISISW